MGITLGIAVKPFNRLYVLRLGCPFVSGYGFRVGEVPFPDISKSKWFHLRIDSPVRS